MARILIAEDEAGIRLLVARALSLEGHDVVTVEDGEEALEVIAGDDDGFDAVLSDIRMPALTGIELAHAVKAVFPDMPIMLMTGYAEQKEAAESLTRIVFGVVEKPFTLTQIRRAMGDLFAAHPPRARAEPIRRAG